MDFWQVSDKAISIVSASLTGTPAELDTAKYNANKLMRDNGYSAFIQIIPGIDCYNIQCSTVNERQMKLTNTRTILMY